MNKTDFFISFHVWVSVFVVGFFAAGGAAFASELDPQWCKLDAPGLFRQLRETSARDDEIVCPSGAAVITLPPRVVIPLPCGRALSFARVDVPAANLLDHMTAQLGGNSDTAPLRVRYSQGQRADAISGTFTLDRNKSPAQPDLQNLAFRAYYIAEYEWTELNHSLYTSGAFEAFSSEFEPTPDVKESVCAEPLTLAKKARFRNVLPKTELSWFAALDISRALNGYIIAEGRRRIARGETPLVPWEQGSSSFVRLPTEAEWEFAAKGGLGGSASDANISTYVITDPDTGSSRIAEIEEVAVVGETSGRRTLAGVGSKLPNALGLYDVVGNAAEIVHDLFKLVRPDRLHGAAGGYVVRGGHSLTPRDLIGVTNRQELAFFDGSGETASGVASVRLALVAPVLVSGKSEDGSYRSDLQNVEFEQALENSHDTLTGIGRTPGSQHRREAQEILIALEHNAQTSDQNNLSDQLTKLQLALSKSEASINAAQAAEMQATAQAAANGIFNIRANSLLSVTTLMGRKRLMDQLAAIPEGTKGLEQARQRLDALRDNVNFSISMIDYQTRTVLSLLKKLALADVKIANQAISVTRSSIAQQGLTTYESAVWPLFIQAYNELRDDPSRNAFVKYRDLFDVNKSRRERLAAEQ